MKGSQIVLGSGWVVAAVLAWFTSDQDIQAAYPSPEQLDDVRFLQLNSSVAIATPRVPHDFNGDGIADYFWVEHFHMEPLFRRSTSGLLRIYSGANHSTLATVAVSTPLSRVTWCGDYDHNGTDDLFVPEREDCVLAVFTPGKR